MRNRISIITALLSIILVPATNSQNIEAFLRLYADEIIRTSDFEFVDKESGGKFSSKKDLPIMQYLKVEPVYLRWHYTYALVHDGLFSLGTELGDGDYSSFGIKYFQFVIDNRDYISRINIDFHDII